jgi:hypothetical protein
MHSNIEDNHGVLFFGTVISGFSISENHLSERLKSALGRSGESDGIKPLMAHIYAYHSDRGMVQLSSPIVFLVNGDGDEPPSAYHAIFPLTEYRMWRFQPSDYVARFDVEIGSVQDLIGADHVPALGHNTPRSDKNSSQGATVIRGADGRVYCIPSDLNTFEVIEEDNKSALELCEGRELSSPRVRILTAEAASAVRSAANSRAALTSRAALASRAALTSRAALVGRAALVESVHGTRDE